MGGEGCVGSADFSKAVCCHSRQWLFLLCCDCLPLPAFYQAAVFDSDLSEWDVSGVTNLQSSKCRMGGWIGNVHVVGGEGERQEC
jgi:hypothetical protein